MPQVYIILDLERKHIFGKLRLKSLKFNIYQDSRSSAWFEIIIYIKFIYNLSNRRKKTPTKHKQKSSILHYTKVDKILFIFVPVGKALHTQNYHIKTWQNFSGKISLHRANEINMEWTLWCDLIDGKKQNAYHLNLHSKSDILNYARNWMLLQISYKN